MVQFLGGSGSAPKKKMPKQHMNFGCGSTRGRDRKKGSYTPVSEANYKAIATVVHDMPPPTCYKPIKYLTKA
jgi:hypothetical protein